MRERNANDDESEDEIWTGSDRESHAAVCRWGPAPAGGADKPMSVFGPHWDDHFSRIAQAWREPVKPEDTVLIPGDISWAMQAGGSPTGSGDRSRRCRAGRS